MDRQPVVRQPTTGAQPIRQRRRRCRPPAPADEICAPSPPRLTVTRRCGRQSNSRGQISINNRGLKGGEGGIRTHGTCVRLFSRQLPSTARPPLPGAPPPARSRATTSYFTILDTMIRLSKHAGFALRLTRMNRNRTICRILQTASPPPVWAGSAYERNRPGR